MTDTHVELPVGEAGRRYVRQRLERGKSLSRAVLAAFPSEGSDPVAIVPAGTDLERALRFDEGGLLTTDTAERALASRLAEIMADGELFVAEHPSARRGDPALMRKQSPISYHGADVYYWTSRADEVREVIRASAAWAVNYFVAGTNGDLDEELSEEELKAFAGQTKVVAISAYDDESFVLCLLSL